MDVFNKKLSHPLFVCVECLLHSHATRSPPISRSSTSVEARYLHSTFALAQSRFELMQPGRGMCSNNLGDVPAVTRMLKAGTTHYTCTDIHGVHRYRFDCSIPITYGYLNTLPL